MIKELSEEHINDCEKLIDALDDTVFKVNYAICIYDIYLERWQLFISSQYVETNGVIKSYRYVKSVIAHINPTLNISLKRISLLNSSNDLIKYLKRDYFSKYKFIKNYENITN